MIFQSHSAKTSTDTKDMLMVSTGQCGLEDMLVETASFEKVVACCILLDNGKAELMNMKMLMDSSVVHR